MKKTTIEDCIKLKLPKIESLSGNLTIAENIDLPFSIKRIYYLYDIPSTAERGGHGHINLEQLIIAVSGSFNIEIFDGINIKNIYLNNPTECLYVKPGIWREINNFSSGSVCLVLASEIYIESDYIRHKESFINYKLSNDSRNFHCKK